MIELTIDSLSYNGGRGVGRHDGIVVFVPGTAPQEKIRARVTARKPRFWEAELVEILEPSPARREPPCPVAAKCGGCSWQHVEYSAQVEQKKKILSDSLRGLVKLGSFVTLPFLSAREEFHYRNRIQLQIRGQQKGFFAQRSNDLVPIEECWIAEGALNKKLKELHPAPEEKKIEIAVSENGEVLIMLGARDPEAALFSQVNRSQNEILKKRVVELIEGEPEWVMDLYAGAGNLTFPLAEKFPSATILAVDLSQASIARGREAAKEKFPQIEWQPADVGRALGRREPAQGDGVIVLDPPRTGCTPDVISELKRHAPKQIVYVSCNPSTFARDCQRLVEDGSFQMQTVQGLDMFPQTEHVEVIASLVRK